MNSIKRVVMVVVLGSASALIGCGSSNEESTGGTPGGGGSGGDGGGATVQLAVQVIAFEPGLDMNVPFEGAEVCLADTDNCDTSDAEGNIELEVPAGSELELLVNAADFSPVLTPIATADEDLADLLAPIISEATLTLLAGALGTPYPPVGTGYLAVSAVVAPIADVANGIAGITMTPTEEAAVYYLDENEFPTYDISATTEPAGVGGLVEVAPGTWELELGGTASNCVIVEGWPGSTATSARFPIREGYFTQGFVTCDPVP